MQNCNLQGSTCKELKKGWAGGSSVCVHVLCVCVCVCVVGGGGSWRIRGM